MNAEPEIGDKIRFKPAAWMDNPEHFSVFSEGREVTGPIVQINKEHRWFRVEFPCGNAIGHECFKF